MKIFFTRLWFRFQLSRGKLIKVDDRHRGVGKTTLMIRRAVKKNLAIVVGNQLQANLIKNINQDIKIIRLAPTFTFEVRGNHDKYPSGVLIDESVNPEMIEILKGNKFLIRGGFIQNYGE